MEGNSRSPHATASGRRPEVAQGHLPLPVADGGSLTYEEFLVRYALARQPCFIKNVGAQWPATTNWRNIRYFLEHEGVDLEYEVEAAAGPPCESREVETTVGEALRRIEAGSGEPFYLSAWPYVRGNSGSLADDFVVPRYFERSPKWVSHNVVLGNAATDMKWLYIGSKGTGSPTHIDTNLSSAWLWLARGRKEWVCAHGDDYELLTEGTGSAAYGYKNESDSEEGETETLPDFFHPELYERWPKVSSARLYHGFQEEGMICFNPSRCVHAVRNVCDSISLTHNFLDATNVADAMFDACRSMNEEILPMSMEPGMKPKTFVKMLAKMMGISRKELSKTLSELPGLLCDENLSSLIDAAASGAEDEESKRKCAEILRRELEVRLREVKPAFVSAATTLRDKLGLV
ncbi:JmjC domain-containing protein [Chloropicon primus]|nr:JmjC domain-containing protein [Chloropicon primus]